MKIRKSYKFRFYPTQSQQKQLAIEFGHARFVWNHALGMRHKAYKRRRESMNYASLGRHITLLKKTNRYKWLKEATASIFCQKLIDLDAAFNNFFKHGAKYPKFKKKMHSQSVRYPLDQRNIEKTYEKGKKLKLPKLGELDITWSRMPDGTPKIATVSKTSSGKYFVSFSCEVESQELPKTGKMVGIDIGIKDVVVTNDGAYSGAPKFTYQYQRKLRSAQRDLSRKTKGSSRWEKQRAKVARIHEKIANSRRDFLHKLTTDIVAKNDVICIEDLNVKGMMTNRKLSKAIADVGIFELRRQLEYKAKWYGREVVVIDPWFPSTKTCSSCGVKRHMKLSQRVFECGCGFTMCRDKNAARNVLAAGLVARGASNQPVKAAA